MDVNSDNGRATDAVLVPFVALGRENAAVRGELTEAFERVVGASAFTLGEEVERFEQAWADTCGTEYCIGVASGTAALTLLLQATGVRPGDEVIVPAHTFFATAAAVLGAGAVPVLCDVDAETGLIDTDAAAALVTPHTAAVLPVHLYGQVCDLEGLAEFAGRHGLAVIEDAAHAHGAERGGLRPGAHGAGAAFSFYPSKNLGALGDGGAICTNDRTVADRARRLRNLGQRAKGDHVDLAGNERLDALQAAFLAVKLRNLHRMNAARRAHADSYRSRLGRHVALLEDVEPSGSVHHLFPVRVHDRDGVLARMRTAGIEVNVHYTPALHGHPALAGRIRTPIPLPRAEEWAATELSLPLSPFLTTTEVHRAADALIQAVGADGHAAD